MIMRNSTVILKKCKLLSINDCQPTNSKFSIADTPQVTRFTSLLSGAWYLLVAWWSLSFKFTWYFRSKEIEFIRRNSMEDIMFFGTNFFRSSWVSSRDPHNKNIISSINSLEKLPSIIPDPSVYCMKSASSRETYSLGTDRIRVKQTRSQERWNSFQRWSFSIHQVERAFSLFPACRWRRNNVLENSGNLRQASNMRRL